jgi:hypothetical protein
MCIACEMGFWDMMEALPPEQRERILREEAARFACEAPAETAPASEDEREPTSEKP